ncbi:hypothetical protein [Streptomyces sp. NPDC057302]|uniref:hypothetical protein n=1 Tax=Streptomyces sp. NPDC057302 TaxID=3346094 RepID=UPI00364400CD
MPIVTSPPYNASGLTPNTAYTVTVTPMRAGQKGTAATATFTTGKVAPAAPTGAALKTSPPTVAGATITYTHDGKNVTKFRLERKPKTGGSWTKVADSAAATDRELKDPGPLTAGDYLWRVIAVDDTTDSPPSNEVAGTVVAPAKLPTPAPVGKGTATTTEFDVEWPAIAGVDASKGDKGYVVSIIPGEPTVSAVDFTTPAKPFVKVTGQIAADTAYTVSVTAKGDGTTKTDSDAGTVDITPTEPAPSAKGYGEGGYGDDTYGGTA